MNILYVKKKVMRMRLESQNIFGSMETGQSAVLPVEEVITHVLFLLLFLFITGKSHLLSYPDSTLKEVMSFNLHFIGKQITWLLLFWHENKILLNNFKQIDFHNTCPEILNLCELKNYSYIFLIISCQYFSQ